MPSRGPWTAWGLHRKNHWKEEDLRTYLSAQRYQKLETVFETYSVIKRDAALAITKGTGLWFYDLHGGWFRGEMMRDLFTDCRDVMAKREDLPFRAEVVVFVDDEVLNGVSKSGEGLMRALYAYEQKTYLGQFGAPYDAYHLSDLAEVPLESYKMVLFLNAFKLSPSQRSVSAQKYKKDHRTLVWVYAPGLIKDEGDLGLHLSPENCAEVTGMPLERAKGAGNLMVRHATAGAPAWLPQGEPPYGLKEKVSPRFFVADENAVTLGHYQTGEVALAMRKFQVTPACRGPGPSAGLARRLGQKRPGFIYTPSRVTVFMSVRGPSVSTPKTLVPKN